MIWSVIEIGIERNIIIKNMLDIVLFVVKDLLPIIVKNYIVDLVNVKRSVE